MVPISSFLIALALSLIVTRVAAMALILTGMSQEAARFQARSAFTGVGYTTREAEEIVRHPTRRRVVMTLMLMGNLGIGAVAATVMLSITQVAESVDLQARVFQLLLLVVGLLLLVWVSTNRHVERYTNKLIAWTLHLSSSLPARDYAAILQLEGGYAVSELLVKPDDWLVGKTLIELRLPKEGLLVLGIHRAEGAYLATPTGSMRVHAGDTVILYGPVGRVQELDKRCCGREGDKAHLEAMDEHREDLGQQVEKDGQIEKSREPGNESS